MRRRKFIITVRDEEEMKVFEKLADQQGFKSVAKWLWFAAHEKAVRDTGIFSKIAAGIKISE